MTTIQAGEFWVADIPSPTESKLKRHGKYMLNPDFETRSRYLQRNFRRSRRILEEEGLETKPQRNFRRSRRILEEEGLETKPLLLK